MEQRSGIKVNQSVSKTVMKVVENQPAVQLSRVPLSFSVRVQKSAASISSGLMMIYVLEDQRRHPLTSIGQIY